MKLLKDRSEAGKLLARKLKEDGFDASYQILALPRGGVPVAFEVAKALKAPLDVYIVRKIGHPSNEEFAIGAIASGGEMVLNDDLIHSRGISLAAVESIAKREGQEILRREAIYRKDRDPIVITGRKLLLIDDGFATGFTMRAALETLKKQNPARLVAAVPVAAESTCRELQQFADEVICLHTPEPFYGVGQWYQDFAQTTDDEVLRLLRSNPSGKAAQTRAEHEHGTNP